MATSSSQKQKSSNFSALEKQQFQLSGAKAKALVKRVFFFHASLFVGAFLIRSVGHFIVTQTFDGYRRGNCRRFVSVLALEWVMAHLSLPMYIHLFSAFNAPFISPKYMVRTRHEKVRLYCFGGFCLLLLMAHLTYLFYFIESFEIPPLLYDLSTISNGIWINLCVLCYCFSAYNLTFKMASAFQLGRRLLDRLFQIRPVKFFSTNYQFQVGLTLVLAALLSLTHWYASDKFVVRHHQVHIARPTQTKQSLRVAVLTDLHAGASIYASEIAKAVGRVNQLEDLDAVFLIGDIVDAPRGLIEERVESLQHLQSRLGTFYVTGNHEYYYGNVVEWFELFDQYGIHVLKNKAIRMKGHCVVGLNDISSDHSGLHRHIMDVNAIKGCPKNETTIVLEHNPSAAKEILAFSKDDSHPVDLILSGHTHSGQYSVLVPFAYFLLPYLYGFYSLNGGATQMLVSAGTLFQNAPMKIPFMSEIWLLDIVPTH